MDPDTRIYYQQRAEEELELAQQAVRTDVVQAHCRLAELYLDQVFATAAASDTPARPDQRSS